MNKETASLDVEDRLMKSAGIGPILLALLMSGSIYAGRTCERSVSISMSNPWHQSCYVVSITYLGTNAGDCDYPIDCSARFRICFAYAENSDCRSCYVWVVNTYPEESCPLGEDCEWTEYFTAPCGTSGSEAYWDYHVFNCPTSQGCPQFWLDKWTITLHCYPCEGS